MCRRPCLETTGFTYGQETMSLNLNGPPARPRGSFLFSGRWILHAACVWLLVGGPVARGGYEPPNPAYDPPAGYYAGATGTETTLRLNLHNIIGNPNVFHGVSYGDA